MPCSECDKLTALYLTLMKSLRAADADNLEVLTMTRRACRIAFHNLDHHLQTHQTKVSRPKSQVNFH